MKNDNALLGRWADIILNQSLRGIVPKDTVLIKGEAVAWPLIAVLQKKILKAGGMADIFLVPPDNARGRVWGAAAAKYARLSALRFVPKWQKERYRNCTKYIEITGMEYPELTLGAEGEGMRRIQAMEEELRRVWLGKPRVITLFPTRAFAAAEKMPFDDYRKFVFDASTRPPASLKRLAAGLRSALAGAKELIIRTRDQRSGKVFELKMSVAGRMLLTDTESLSNIPCGEVYTSPDARSAEGEIFIDLPCSTHGDIIRGVFLKFVSGKIVAFRAEEGMRELSQIINTDDGSKRIGEVAFGINSGLRRPLLHPLFAEKLAGTMHVAIGNSFPWAFVKNPASCQGRVRYRELLASGVANKSSQHIDLVISFKKGGAGTAVLIDGKRLNIRGDNWRV